MEESFLFHVLRPIVLNGSSVAIATYSAFGANPSIAVDDAISEMQQGLTQEFGSSSNETITQLAELRKWEDVNRWIISCAAYAVIFLSFYFSPQMDTLILMPCVT